MVAWGKKAGAVSAAIRARDSARLRSRSSRLTRSPVITIRSGAASSRAARSGPSRSALCTSEIWAIFTPSSPSSPAGRGTSYQAVVSSPCTAQAQPPAAAAPAASRRAARFHFNLLFISQRPPHPAGYPRSRRILCSAGADQNQYNTHSTGPESSHPPPPGSAPAPPAPAPAYG